MYEFHDKGSEKDASLMCRGPLEIYPMRLMSACGKFYYRSRNKENNANGRTRYPLAGVTESSAMLPLILLVSGDRNLHC